MGFFIFSSASAQRPVYQFSGGQWFDGTRFVRTTFYSVNGMLTKKRPSGIDSAIDLKGRYVVPPFGDAHHHGIDSPEGLDKKINSFLHDGIFYVKNPNVIPQLLNGVREKLNKRNSIDVSFSNGGLTASGGHPVPLHKWLISQGAFKGITEKDLENKAYFIIDNEDDLLQKWDTILAGKPDFIKTFLLNASEFENRKNNPEFEGQRGLNPVLLSKIVLKAHRSNLQVSTHIENTEDFRLAVEAGVDEINHIPLPHSLKADELIISTISNEVAQQAAKKKIRVVGTLCWALFSGFTDTGSLNTINRLNKKNVQTLYNNGVTLTIGSDGISGENPMKTGLTEAMYWHEQNFLDNLALLKVWTENTAKTIFPKRKIGILKEGYEASFLVLQGNPLENFEHIKKISLRFKQGVFLQ
jgi:hypothetical protein